MSATVETSKKTSRKKASPKPEVAVTEDMKNLTVQEEYTDEVIKNYLIRFTNLYARKEKKLYEFAYGADRPKTDLVVEWKTIVSYIQEIVKPPKKLFKVSAWKAQMKALAAAPCIAKVAWR